MTAGKTAGKDNDPGDTNDSSDTSGFRSKHAALVALGQQIRKVRTERGISQEDFAAKAGLGRSYYGGIERGERNVAALNLMRIAVALGVETGQLFPATETMGTLLDGTSTEGQ